MTCELSGCVWVLEGHVRSEILCHNLCRRTFSVYLMEINSPWVQTPDIEQFALWNRSFITITLCSNHDVYMRCE